MRWERPRCTALRRWPTYVASHHITLPLFPPLFPPSLYLSPSLTISLTISLPPPLPPQTPVIALLLQARAPAAARDVLGLTALDWAEAAGHGGISVELLRRAAREEAKQEE